MTPPPRLVPDRPSAVAIGNAFLSYFRPDGFAMYPSSGSELFREVLERAREIDAAAPPAEAPAERGDAVRWALNAAQDWIGHAPHGDNCYLDRSEVGGHPGNRCNCGKDGVLTLIEEAQSADSHIADVLRAAQLAAAPAAPAEGVSRADAEVMVDGIIETAWLEGSEHRKAWGQRLMDLRNELVRTLTAPRVTGGREARLSDAQIEAGWQTTFSTTNPFCPCDLRSFTKAVRWAERAALQAATGGGES